MQISYILRAADGAELRHTMHSTINWVPGSRARSSAGR
jgi:hypothetical protein